MHQLGGGMDSTKFIGRVGTLAVTLGIGAVIGNGCGTAGADSSGPSATTQHALPAKNSAVSTTSTPGVASETAVGAGIPKPSARKPFGAAAVKVLPKSGSNGVVVPAGGAKTSTEISTPVGAA